MTESRILSERYALTGHLARGGMADVYAAEDRALGRKVAVKILHPQFARDEAFVTRFRREAQAAANLGHPNIVSIFDWGQDQDTYYMVMELIEGRTLRDIRRTEGPLLPRRAAEVAAEAAAALTVAHQAGVFHRDIKPGNIMLTPDGSVKVTDFGIARALDDSEELTRTGAVIGTATYFSPEQAQGIPADARSDVYSLGVVLYELLSGQPPFTGESPVAVAYQHVSEFAVPIRQINPDLPPPLEAIVSRAMEKDPAARYQTADEMRTDLLRFLRGEPPVAAAAVAAAAATQVMASPLPPATVPPDETARMVAPPVAEPSRPQYGYVLAIVGLLAVLAVGVWILSQLLTNDDNGPPAASTTITVPELAGMEWREASDELQDLGLRVRQRSEVSDEVDAELVIRTEPAAGDEVEADSPVTLVVSAGPQQFTLPNVQGDDLETALEKLRANGFEVGEITETPSDSVPEGNVIRQLPPPGNAAPGTVVDLEVSNGPFAIAMPELVNRTEESALVVLSDAGIAVDRVIVQEEFSNDIVAGFVMETDPESGDPVLRDATVTLIVSKGPEPIAVPDLIGKTLTEAEQIVVDLGLEFSVADEPVPVSAASNLAGLVAEQTPVFGDEVFPGDGIQVTAGVLQKVTVPSVLGETIEDATDLLEAAGFVVVVGEDLELAPGSALIGFVADQDPAGETSQDDGSTVTIRLGVAPPDEDPPEPDGD